MTIEKIKYRRVYEDVIEQIKKMITEGNLSAGDVLPTERYLAEAFGISRGTLREAFRILENEGLIETRPGGGRYLSKSIHREEERNVIFANIERATIIELFEAREIFEVGIVELAAVRATREDLKEIEIALHKQGADEADGDSDDYTHPDHKFHLTIAKATHNIVLVNLIELHMDLIRKMRLKVAGLTVREDEIYKEHYQIFEAIKNRDPITAKEALLYHLRRAKDHV